MMGVHTILNHHCSPCEVAYEQAEKTDDGADEAEGNGNRCI
jgi:hypothetical protein